MANFKILCGIAANRHNMIRAFKIALVVGMILNLINQGEVIFGLDMASIDFTKAILTFFVPFFVSLYTAITIGMRFYPGRVADLDIKLQCSACKDEPIRVGVGEVIPICSKCGVKTVWKLKGSGEKGERNE